MRLQCVWTRALVVRRCVHSLSNVGVITNKLAALRAALFTDAQALPQNPYKRWMHPRHIQYDEEFKKRITYVTTQDVAEVFMAQVIW